VELEPVAALRREALVRDEALPCVGPVRDEVPRCVVEASDGELQRVAVEPVAGLPCVAAAAQAVVGTPADVVEVGVACDSAGRPDGSAEPPRGGQAEGCG